MDLGPANSITVTGPPGGTITVWAHGRAISLEVSEGEPCEQVARRLADVLNGGGGPPAKAIGAVLDVDLSGRGRRWETEREATDRTPTARLLRR